MKTDNMGNNIYAVILKCPPGGQFHFGKIALDVDTSLNDTDIVPRSDTLFSAIISTASKMYGEVQDLINWFIDGSLQISSGSYCLDMNGAYFYLLPKPVHYDLISDSKKLRKVSFIDTTTWSEELQPNNWEDSCSFIQERFVIHRSLLQKDIAKNINIFHKSSFPKVAIHKPRQDNSLYFQTNIQVATNNRLQDFDIIPKVHFYFLLRHENKTAYTKLQTVLEVIADEGIGGERSVGCGKLEGIEFKDAPKEFRDLEAIVSDYRVSLSLINPRLEEFSRLKAYKILTRGGRRIPFPKSSDETEYNKKSKLKRVRMLSEGGLIEGEIKGRIVDIAPLANNGQPYKRSGLAFTLPIKLSKIVQDELFS